MKNTGARHFTRYPHPQWLVMKAVANLSQGPTYHRAPCCSRLWSRRRLWSGCRLCRRRRLHHPLRDPWLHDSMADILIIGRTITISQLLKFASQSYVPQVGDYHKNISGHLSQACSALHFQYSPVYVWIRLPVVLSSSFRNHLGSYTLDSIPATHVQVHHSQINTIRDHAWG